MNPPCWALRTAVGLNLTIPPGLATTGLSGPVKLSVEFLQPEFILFFSAICDVTTLCFPPLLRANVLRR